MAAIFFDKHIHRSPSTGLRAPCMIWSGTAGYSPTTRGQYWWKIKWVHICWDNQLFSPLPVGQVWWETEKMHDVTGIQILNCRAVPARFPNVPRFWVCDLVLYTPIQTNSPFKYIPSSIVVKMRPASELAGSFKHNQTHRQSEINHILTSWLPWET